MKPKVGLSRACRSGMHADALHPADDPVALLEAAQLAAFEPPAVDDDGGVHPLAGHGRPLAADQHLGAVVGGGVEVLRGGAVDVVDAHDRVRRALHVAAERRQRGQQVVEALAGLGRQAQRQPRRGRVGASHVEAQDLVAGALLDDGGEDGLQVARVDQVAFGVDRLRNHARPCGRYLTARPWVRPGARCRRRSGSSRRRRP